METHTSLLIRNASLVLPDRLTRADLLIENGRVARIEPSIPPRSKEEVVDAGGKYILPGFVDIHNHGARGFDCSLGVWQDEQKAFALEAGSYRQGLAEALAYYRQNGVTRVFLTSLAAPLDDLAFAFRQIDAYCREKQPLHAMIGGINLEGTFLKLPAYAGAQSPDYFYPPEEATMERLQAAAGGRIRIVNLPPEHGAGGRALIRALHEQGVLVAAGHTGAEADEFQEAIAAGTRLGVHFFNGPARSSSKSFHDGGAEEAMLRSDAVSLELIVDGYHVHPAYVLDTIARKGVERIVLITDSMFVNGCDDIHSFELCGVPGAVSANRRYLQVTDRADTLFGSVLTSRRGFENVLNWLTREMTGIWYRRHEALPLNDALVTAARMASTNPAHLTGLADAGSIAPGKRADLLIAAIEHKEEGYEVSLEQVLVGGKCN